jgi:hypothetical protein
MMLESYHVFLVSIVVSIPACHAGDPGSIPGRGEFYVHLSTYLHLEPHLHTSTPFFHFLNSHFGTTVSDP